MYIYTPFLTLFNGCCFISAVSAQWDCHWCFGNASLIPGATQAKKKGITFSLVILFTEPPSLGFSLCKGFPLQNYFPVLYYFWKKISAPPTDHHPSSFYFRITVLSPVRHRKKKRLELFPWVLTIWFTETPSLGFSLWKVKVLPLIHKESSSSLSPNLCYHETTKKRNKNMHLAPSHLMESAAYVSFCPFRNHAHACISGLESHGFLAFKSFPSIL